jgi:hypothetical protein
MHGIERWASRLSFIFCIVSSFVPERANAGALSDPLCGKDVDCIVRRHVTASGGREALMGMVSISRFGSIKFFGSSAGESESFTYRTDIVYPNKLREELKGQRILVDRGTDGAVFWQWTGTGFETVRARGEVKSMSETAERANRDILWLKDEIADLAVSTRIPAWAADSTCLEGAWRGSDGFICFDPARGLMTAKGNDNEYRLFSQWRRAGKVSVPFHISHFAGGRMVYEILLSRVEVDGPIDAARFSPPGPVVN